MQTFLQSFLLSLIFLQTTFAWVQPFSSTVRGPKPLEMAIGLKIGKNYTPKWKKKETLADQAADLAPQDKGIAGTIPVVFKSGASSITALASPGDPIRDVASQAGQFIKYGCGKGDCGTCQAMCNGKWIKPCVAVVPGDIMDGQDYVIEVKEVKNKSKSSGKFYSVRSFFMGFYNNLLGMVGFVRTRRAAKKNYEERIEYEDIIARRTAEKKAARLAAQADNKKI